MSVQASRKGITLENQGTPQVRSVSLLRQFAIQICAIAIVFVTQITSMEITSHVGRFGAGFLALIFFWPLLILGNAIVIYVAVRACSSIVMTWPTALVMAPLLLAAAVTAAGLRSGPPFREFEWLLSDPVKFVTDYSGGYYIFSSGCVWLAFVIGGFRNRPDEKRELHDNVSP